jgi:hypothetical protein
VMVPSKMDSPICGMITSVGMKFLWMLSRWDSVPTANGTLYKSRDASRKEAVVGRQSLVVSGSASVRGNSL